MRKVILLILLGLIATGCKRGPRDPDAEIQEFVTKMEKHAEAKELADIKQMIDLTFRGKGRYNKKQLASLINFQFLRRRHIHILSRVTEIRFPSPKLAVVEVIAGLAGQKVDAPSAFEGIRADVIKFRFQLRDFGEWRMIKADWRRGKISDLMKIGETEVDN